MKCPNCSRHVTPLAVWVREYLDDPRDCPHCRQRLLPSRRAMWWAPAFVVVPVTAFVVAVALEVGAAGAGPWWAAALAGLGVSVAAGVVLGAAYLAVWATGVYRRDDSDPAGGNPAGLELSAYDLQHFLRAAVAAEQAGDWPRAVEKYEAIAEYAGGAHPNAELARERVRELRARMGEPGGG
jgi:hypothetical protein